MTATASAPSPTPAEAPETSSNVVLILYRLVVRAEVQPGKFDVLNYWVEAPTQCSAGKHTALRDEIDDIMLIEKWSHPLPAGASITFRTEKDCP
jgi:hypothetical protein